MKLAKRVMSFLIALVIVASEVPILPKVVEAAGGKVDFGGNAFAEMKQGTIKNQKFEAMAGVPTTEDLYFEVGGSYFAGSITTRPYTKRGTRKYQIYFPPVGAKYMYRDIPTKFNDKKYWPSNIYSSLACTTEAENARKAGSKQPVFTELGMWFNQSLKSVGGADDNNSDGSQFLLIGNPDYDYVRVPFDPKYNTSAPNFVDRPIVNGELPTPPPNQEYNTMHLDDQDKDIEVSFNYNGAEDKEFKARYIRIELSPVTAEDRRALVINHNWAQSKIYGVENDRMLVYDTYLGKFYPETLSIYVKEEEFWQDGFSGSVAGSCSGDCCDPYYQRHGSPPTIAPKSDYKWYKRAREIMRRDGKQIRSIVAKYNPPSLGGTVYNKYNLQIDMRAHRAKPNWTPIWGGPPPSANMLHQKKWLPPSKFDILSWAYETKCVHPASDCCRPKYDKDGSIIGCYDRGCSEKINGPWYTEADYEVNSISKRKQEQWEPFSFGGEFTSSVYIIPESKPFTISGREAEMTVQGSYITWEQDYSYVTEKIEKVAIFQLNQGILKHEDMKNHDQIPRLSDMGKFMNKDFSTTNKIPVAVYDGNNAIGEAMDLGSTQFPVRLYLNIAQAETTGGGRLRFANECNMGEDVIWVAPTVVDYAHNRGNHWFKDKRGLFQASDPEVDTGWFYDPETMLRIYGAGPNGRGGEHNALMRSKIPNEVSWKVGIKKRNAKTGSEHWMNYCSENVGYDERITRKTPMTNGAISAETYLESMSYGTSPGKRVDDGFYVGKLDLGKNATRFISDYDRFKKTPEYQFVKSRILQDSQLTAISDFIICQTPEGEFPLLYKESYSNRASDSATPLSASSFRVSESPSDFNTRQDIKTGYRGNFKWDESSPESRINPGMDKDNYFGEDDYREFKTLFHGENHVDSAQEAYFWNKLGINYIHWKSIYSTALPESLSSDYINMFSRNWRKSNNNSLYGAELLFKDGVRTRFSKANNAPGGTNLENIATDPFYVAKDANTDSVGFMNTSTGSFYNLHMLVNVGPSSTSHPTKHGFGSTQCSVKWSYKDQIKSFADVGEVVLREYNDNYNGSRLDSKLAMADGVTDELYKTIASSVRDLFASNELNDKGMPKSIFTIQTNTQHWNANLKALYMARSIPHRLYQLEIHRDPRVNGFRYNQQSYIYDKYRKYGVSTNDAFKWYSRLTEQQIRQSDFVGQGLSFSRVGGLYAKDREAHSYGGFYQTPHWYKSSSYKNGFKKYDYFENDKNTMVPYPTQLLRPRVVDTLKESNSKADFGEVLGEGLPNISMKVAKTRAQWPRTYLEQFVGTDNTMSLKKSGLPEDAKDKGPGSGIVRTFSSDTEGVEYDAIGFNSLRAQKEYLSKKTHNRLTQEQYIAERGANLPQYILDQEGGYYGPIVKRRKTMEKSNICDIWKYNRQYITRTRNGVYSPGKSYAIYSPMLVYENRSVMSQAQYPMTGRFNYSYENITKPNFGNIYTRKAEHADLGVVAETLKVQEKEYKIAGAKFELSVPAAYSRDPAVLRTDYPSGEDSPGKAPYKWVNDIKIHNPIGMVGTTPISSPDKYKKDVKDWIAGKDKGSSWVLDEIVTTNHTQTANFGDREDIFQLEDVYPGEGGKYVGKGYTDGMDTSLWTQEVYMYYDFDIIFADNFFKPQERITMDSVDVKKAYFYLPISAGEHRDFLYNRVGKQPIERKRPIFLMRSINSIPEDEVDAPYFTVRMNRQGDPRRDGIYRKANRPSPDVEYSHAWKSMSYYGLDNFDMNNPTNTKQHNKDDRFPSLTSLSADTVLLYGPEHNVYGRIGNLKMEDTTDKRFARFFKRVKLENVDRTATNRYMLSDQVDIRKRPLSEKFPNQEKLDYKQYSKDYSVGNKGEKPPNVRDEPKRIQLNTNGGKLEFENLRTFDLPLQPKHAAHDYGDYVDNKPGVDKSMADQPLRIGYKTILDIETQGQYTDSLSVTPVYYLVEFDGKSQSVKFYPADIYAKIGDRYMMINNYPGSGTNSGKKVVSLSESLDWENETFRRNFYNQFWGRGAGDTYESVATSEVSVLEAQQPYRNLKGVESRKWMPVGRYHVYGDQQRLNLTQRNRTYIGNYFTYDNNREVGVYDHKTGMGGLANSDFINFPTVPTGFKKWRVGVSNEYDPKNMRQHKFMRTEPIEWAKYAQRWHFSMGLPSSAIAIPNSSAPDANGKFKKWQLNKEAINRWRANNIVILMNARIRTTGDVWTLQYNYEQDQVPEELIEVPPNPDPNKPKPNIPPVVPPKPPGEPERPIAIISSDHSSTEDLYLKGTH